MRSLKADVSCANTGHYADPYGELRGVVVHGYVTIELEERSNAVNLNNNKITLESRTRERRMTTWRNIEYTI